jgi:hypothetical protein
MKKHNVIVDKATGSRLEVSPGVYYRNGASVEVVSIDDDENMATITVTAPAAKRLVKAIQAALAEMEEGGEP